MNATPKQPSMFPSTYNFKSHYRLRKDECRIMGALNAYSHSFLLRQVGVVFLTPYMSRLLLKGRKSVF